VIVLRAKDVTFETTYINLRQKPDWFLKISPHGKVPVLKVNDHRLFESNAIAEYLDEVIVPRLHPADPLARARHRAWTDFTPDFAKSLSGIYYTKTKDEMEAALKAAPERLVKVEEAIAEERGDKGPFFSGADLCLVDAAYAPFLQRFALVDAKLHTGLLKAFPLLQAWSNALLGDERITGSVPANFNDEFVANLKRREFYVGGLFEAKALAS
jgi:glutathione S-transferase